MSGRALLIGAGYQDLRGVENDVAAMEAALSRRGFESRCCIRGDATRKRVLEEYEQLIDEAADDEAVVVYFSGHGGYARAPESDGFAIQFIVPNDYDESVPDDFRGITSVELSVLQSRLSEKTKNVTVVLDCCHSGQMSRDQQYRTKSVPPASYPRLKAHLDRLEAEGLRVDSWRNEGHPDVVRVVACSPRQSAFEYLSDDGRIAGVLTESLVLALTEAERQTVPWLALMDRVRSRIVRLSYDQRPEVEGPVERQLFELAKADLLMSLPVAPLDDAGRVRLDCAPLLAVQEGDQFMVMPSGATLADRAHRIGDLTVDSIAPLWADGVIALAPGAAGDAAALMGARAFRTRIQAPRIRVIVPVGDPRSAALTAALGAGSLVEAVPPGEPDWTAQVRIEADGTLSVCDRIGPLHPPRTGDGPGIVRVTEDLKILAQAAQLRRLVGSPWCALRAEVDVEWGRVVGAERQPLRSGVVVHRDEKIYVQLHNRSPATVYVSMVDIGVSGKITVLTKGAPAGWEVHRGESYTFGENRRAGILTGSVVKWPEGLDAAFGRPETILVVVTSDPHDLRPLEQPDLARSRTRSRVVSPLQDMIDQLAIGGARDVGAEAAPDATLVRYDIHAVSFDVDAHG